MFAVDLTAPLPEPLRAELANAHRVVHFAWDRDRDAARCRARNRAMIENLIDAMPSPERFVFISSTAAGPAAPGTYGACKFEMEDLVRSRGGTVLIVGLVTDPEAGVAYAKIRRAVEGLPFSFRFGARFRFYPVSARELAEGFGQLASGVPPGTYAAYPAQGVAARDFLGALEREAPRFRMPMFVPSRLLVGLLRVLTKLGLGRLGAIETLSTFLYMDAARLGAVSAPAAGAPPCHPPGGMKL